MRLDLYLAEKGLARSRSHATNLIKLNKVAINGKTAEKPSQEVDDTFTITASLEDDFASLGRAKLAHALSSFAIDPNGKVCVDIGASNGGFTDVLLRAGAKKVYAVDVATCALPDSLKHNPKVAIKDNLNARFMTHDDIGERADLIVCDVSFISLTLIIPQLLGILAPNGDFIGLIKPQFECGKKALNKNGIAVDNKAVAEAIERVKAVSVALGFAVRGVEPAPRPFANKNQEYLIHLTL